MMLKYVHQFEKYNLIDLMTMCAYDRRGALLNFVLHVIVYLNLYNTDCYRDDFIYTQALFWGPTLIYNSYTFYITCTGTKITRRQIINIDQRN